MRDAGQRQRHRRPRLQRIDPADAADDEDHARPSLVGPNDCGRGERRKQYKSDPRGVFMNRPSTRDGESTRSAAGYSAVAGGRQGRPGALPDWVRRLGAGVLWWGGRSAGAFSSRRPRSGRPTMGRPTMWPPTSRRDPRIDGRNGGNRQSRAGVFSCVRRRHAVRCNPGRPAPCPRPGESPSRPPMTFTSSRKARGRNRLPKNKEVQPPRKGNWLWRAGLLAALGVGAFAVAYGLTRVSWSGSAAAPRPGMVMNSARRVHDGHGRSPHHGQRAARPPRPRGRLLDGRA